jgi:hypothetical protein
VRRILRRREMWLLGRGRRWGGSRLIRFENLDFDLG